MVNISSFYEIALAIGNSLNLTRMLKECLPVYLKNLNCHACVVYQIGSRENQPIVFTSIFSIPYTIRIREDYQDILKKISGYTSDINHEDLLDVQINSITTNNSLVYFMNLQRFGLLVLIKDLKTFDDLTLSNLQKVNLKLSQACIACSKNEALEESENRYRELSELLPEMICETDLQGKLIYANTYAIKKMGYSESDLSNGVNIFSIFAPPDSEKARQNFQNALSQDDLSPREYLVRKKNGEIFPGVVYTNRIMKHGRPTGVRGVMIDITARTNQEKTIKENADRLELALIGSNAGLWDWNIKTGEMFFSQRYCSMLGYNNSEIEPTIYSKNSLIHPEDLELYSEGLTKHINGQTDLYQSEYRIKTKQNQWKWVLDTGKVIERKNGEALRAVGTIIDITEKKENELFLQRNLHQQEILSEVALTLNSLDSFADKIEDVIKIIGLHISVSRVYIIEAHANNKEDVKIIDWINSEISEHQNNWEKLKYSYLPGLREKVVADGIFCVNDTRLLPPEWKEYFESKEIKSTLIYPIYVSGKYAGCIGFDECTTLKNWSQNELRFLKIISGIISNAFERRKVEISLMESEATNRAIIEALPDTLFHFNKEGILLKHNFAKSNFSIFNEVRVNRKISHLFPRLFAENLKEAIEKCNQNFSYQYQFHLNFDTVKAYFESRLQKVNENEVIVLIRDITDKHNYEEELKEAKIKAELANTAKSEFLANMSHEIRTPMNAILGFTESLFYKVSDPAQKHMLKTVLNSGKVLLSLINDILDMSKIEAGKLELQYQAVDLKNLISEMHQIFQEKVVKKNLSIKTTMSENFPTYIILDEIRIRQVIFNLLGNAVKFTSEGNISLFAVFSHTSEKFGTLTLEVEDTGIGIPESEQEIIFEAFRQQSGQSNRKYEGSGLGLAITKKLVEKMNGKISVKSTVNKGSLFCVVIENIEIAPYQHILPENRENELQEVEFEKSEILIVDDVKSNIEMLKSLIDSQNIAFLDAENGEIALRLLNIHHPDLIFMDLRMPVMDGFQTTKEIRKNQNLSNIPIIAISASVLEIDKIRNENLFNEFLYKPANKRQIINTLIKYLPHKTKTKVNEANKTKIYAKPDYFEELQQRFLNSHMDQWKTVKDKLIISKIEDFIKNIEKTAEEYPWEKLIDYLTELKVSLSTFDLTSLQEKINQFPDLIKDSNE